jgi:ATP-dependent Clp protease ATP-binding subunit ClpX
MKHRNAFCSFCRKSYREVGPLVEGPPGDVYICGECVELCQSIIDQEKRRRLRPEGHQVLPAETIQEKLDQLVTGQQKAKEALAVAAHSHYQRFGHGGERKAVAHEDKRVILLVGPTRSSKVFLARTLAHTLDVPFAQGVAGALANVVSNDQAAEHPLYRLLVTSEYDAEAAQRGIVYIDGADEPNVQGPLLQLLKGKLSLPLLQRLQMELADILFIYGGTFIGLDQVMARRGRHQEQRVTNDDLVAFGMLPELVGQVQVIAEVASLDEETLVRTVSAVELECLTFDE